MKRDRRRVKQSFAGLAAIAQVLVAGTGLAQGYPAGEAHTRYLGNQPDRAEPEWSENLNGLANDGDDHWFVTQRDRIWRVPVSVDLGAPYWPIHPAGLVSRRLDQDIVGWDHFGDPHYLRVGGQGYLLVPLEKSDLEEHQRDLWCGTLVVYRDEPSDLRFVTRTCLPDQRDKAPWLAVGPDGVLYTSHFDVLRSSDEAPGRSTGIHRYRVNWETLADPVPRLVLEPLAPLKPYDAAGNPMELQDVQGGVLSPSGRTLFLVSDEDGIFVFRVAGDRLELLERSCNAGPSASCRFSFEFDNTSWNWDSLAQEPEGIDFWDLNDGRVPGVRGELHVALIDVEADWDDLWIKHYTATQWVDGGATTTGSGTQTSPYRSLDDALRRAWPGSRIRMRGGRSYPTALPMSVPLLLESWGGAARVTR
jgi:hypothetical protein